MEAVLDSMRRRRIPAQINWVQACVEWIRHEEGSSIGTGPLQDLVYEQWLHSDIRDTCTGSLPSSLLATPTGTLDGSHIVQVDSCINVGSSAYGQLMKLTGSELEPEPEQQASSMNTIKPDRMFYMKLTDGSVSCQAMEYSTINQLPNEVVPGTKLCILGPIEYRLGTLLLADSHVTVLGGAVEHLVQENCLEKVLARELNREDLIGSQSDPNSHDNDIEPHHTSVESILLLPIDRIVHLLTETSPPPVVYVKSTIIRLNGSLSPIQGVWSLRATIADGTGELPVLLGNGPLEILIGFTAEEFQGMPRVHSEEGLRKCREILSSIHCVMELQLRETDEPLVTRLLDVQ